MNLPVANQPHPQEKPPASSRFQFATGDRPLSGYTIKRGVGRGGFGEVYFAVSDGGKEVALKLIRRNLDVELRGVQHCLNLKHPNLIALYDVRRDGDDDDCWIVMEYVAGESLEGAIRRQPQGMPPDEAVDWLRGIAAGASYLHSHGIVHRDLKPGNVFRDESLVKLGDYGLSKFISCSRRSGQTESVGTVHYMAPEIAHGRYGREIDIYALGIILYEMLTGRVPFDGESVGEVLMKHLTAQPDVSAVPVAYRPVVARALAKDPAVRFSSIEQFLAALPGARPGPAAAAPVEPEFDQGQKTAARRAGSPTRPAASDPTPPAGILWLLGAIVVLLALSPALAFLSMATRADALGSRLLGMALLGGIILLCFLARSRAPWKARGCASGQDWPGPADRAEMTAAAAARPEFYYGANSAAPGIEPPVRPAAFDPATADRQRRDQRPEPWLLEFLAGMPPAVVWIVGAVLSILAIRLLGTVISKGFGGPSSLLLIAVALFGGWAANSMVKKRARQRSGNRHATISDFPDPSPAAPLATGGQPSLDRAAEPWQRTGGFPPLVAGIIGAIFAGLAMPLLFCFALDIAGNSPALADPVHKIQSEIRMTKESSTAFVLIGLAAFGGFASYSLANRKAGRNFLLLHPAFLAAVSAFLVFAVPKRLQANGIIGVDVARVLVWALLAAVVYFLFKARARSRAGNRLGSASRGQRPLSPADAPPRSAFHSAAFAVGRAVRWVTDQPTPALVVKSAGERSIELLESLLLSAAVATVLSVIAVAWQGEDSGPEEGAWFALTATLGGWGILVLSKLWEGSSGEPILRRFAMLVVGLALGAASFGFDRLLMVRLPFKQTMRPTPWHVDWSFYDRLNGVPHLEAYLAYFGLLFFCVQWWRQADPLRTSRLKIGSLAATLAVAVLLQLICPFPQPWGAIVAGIISLAVQLASPPAAKTSQTAVVR